MAIGRCPECKGKGTVDRPGTGFAQLCGRCQGNGKTNLSGTEHDSDFAQRATQGFSQAEQRRAAGADLKGGNRPFQSGMDPAELRKRRDEIRRLENRPVPPAEPKPDPETASSVADAGRKCPCGMAIGDCNGCCD